MSTSCLFNIIIIFKCHYYCYCYSYFICLLSGMGQTSKVLLTFQTGRPFNRFHRSGLASKCFGLEQVQDTVGLAPNVTGMAPSRPIRSVFPHTYSAPSSFLHSSSSLLLSTVLLLPVFSWGFCAPCSCFAWICCSTFKTAAAGFSLLSSAVHGHYGH